MKKFWESGFPHVNNVPRDQAAFALGSKFGGMWSPVYECFYWTGQPASKEEAGEVVYRYFFMPDDLEYSKGVGLNTESSPLRAYLPRSIRPGMEDLILVERCATNERSVTIFRRL